jgi:hypothetical protein
MKHFSKLFIVLMLAAAPAAAQTATGTGVGISSANSKSQSGAVAISGQGGQGGNSSLTLNSSVPATTTSNINQNVTGTSTIRNVPTAIAPGLTAAGLETCLGSVSGGASVVGFGGSFGTTIPDPGCAARLDARTLWSMGLKKAAVARLCLTPEIYRSMPDVCGAYLPAAPGSAVAAVAAVAPAVEVAPYLGGPIELIDGKTGQMRMCDDYDQARQRCRLWTGQQRHHPHRKIAAVSPNKPVATLAAAKPAADSAAEPKKEN